jgi:hypothetical protein
VGIFTERDIDLKELDANFTDEEMRDLQHQSLLSEIDFLIGKVEKLCHRVQYYGEAVDLDKLQELRADLQHAKKIIL